MTASEANTLRIDRDELRAAGRRAHGAGKLTDAQLRMIEALCGSQVPPSNKVDLSDGAISGVLELDEVEVEWVEVPFPQGGLASAPPPAAPVGERSAEWLSDSIVLEGERSAEWLSDSIVLEGEVSVAVDGGASIVELGDSAVIEEVPAAWLGDSAVVEAEVSAVALGDSAILEGEASGEIGEVSADWGGIPEGEHSAEWERPESERAAALRGPVAGSWSRAPIAENSADFTPPPAERSADWGGSNVGAMVASPAAVIRSTFESAAPSEEWSAGPSAPWQQPASEPSPVVAAAHGSAEWSRGPASSWATPAPADWPASEAPTNHGRMQDARFPGDDGTGREEDAITNHPAEGWAHVGARAVGKVEAAWEDDKVDTRPPADLVPFGRAPAPFPAAMATPFPAAMAAPFPAAMATPFPVAVPTPRVEPASPKRVPAWNGATLLSAQLAPTNASVSGSSGFAPLRAGTKLRTPLQGSALIGDVAMIDKKKVDDEDKSSITARYPWLAPVIFAAALVLGLVGEWMLTTATPAPPVAVAPKPEAAAVVQPAAAVTPSISVVGVPANAR